MCSAFSLQKHVLKWNYLNGAKFIALHSVAKTVYYMYCFNAPNCCQFISQSYNITRGFHVFIAFKWEIIRNYKQIKYLSVRKTNPAVRKVTVDSIFLTEDGVFTMLSLSSLLQRTWQPKIRSKIINGTKKWDFEKQINIWTHKYINYFTHWNPKLFYSKCCE